MIDWLVNFWVTNSDLYAPFYSQKGAKIWVYHQNPGHSKYGSEKRL